MSHLLLLVPLAALIIVNLVPRTWRPAAAASPLPSWLCRPSR